MLAGLYGPAGIAGIGVYRLHPVPAAFDRCIPDDLARITGATGAAPAQNLTAYLRSTGIGSSLARQVRARLGCGNVRWDRSTCGHPIAALAETNDSTLLRGLSPCTRDCTAHLNAVDEAFGIDVHGRSSWT